jgi:hypothetical protein
MQENNFPKIEINLNQLLDERSSYAKQIEMLDASLDKEKLAAKDPESLEKMRQILDLEAKIDAVDTKLKSRN